MVVFRNQQLVERVTLNTSHSQRSPSWLFIFTLVEMAAEETAVVAIVKVHTFLLTVYKI